MNVIRTEALSPAWFENHWLAWEQRLIKGLANLVQRLPLAGMGMILLVTASWFWLVHIYNPMNSVHFGDRIWLIADAAFYPVLLFATGQIFVTKLSRASVRSAASLGIFVGTFFVCWWRGVHDGTTDVVAGVLQTWLTIPLILMAAQVSGWLSRRALILALAFNFAVLPSVYAWFFPGHSVLTNEVWYLVWSDRLIIPFVVVLAEIWQNPVVTSSMLFDLNRLALLFSPVFFFYVLPLSSRDLHHKKPFQILLSAAFVGFVRLIIFKVIDVHLEDYLLTYKATHPAWGWLTLWYAWLVYLQFFMFSYIGLNIGIALGRCLGLALEDGTHFTLLAVSPLERWRRWNSYYYGWLFRFIFIPLFQGSRNYLFSIQVVFLVTFLFHASRLVTVQFLPHSEPGIMNVTVYQLLFFQLHGLAVFVSGYLPAWTQDAQKRRAWVGVVITHLMMAIIHLVPLRF